MLNTRSELDHNEKMARMVYDESYFILRKNSYSEYGGDSSELNTIIDMTFKLNEDISGYRSTGQGGMISYTNPYGPYYYVAVPNRDIPSL